ncbi:hypothetical protein ACFZBU_00955 [Embleya sp. NPDC008237]|uniref:hypothetical protein n=1 Tax=Embleya sp. NPDC008237 TaxID=3363978 RepID=UPI0036EE5DB3
MSEEVDDTGSEVGEVDGNNGTGEVDGADGAYGVEEVAQVGESVDWKSPLLGCLIGMLITPFVLVGGLYAASGSFRSVVSEVFRQDDERSFQQRAQRDICRDGVLRLRDVTDFAWDTVYLGAAEDTMARRYGESVRLPRSSDDEPVTFVFVKGREAVRTYEVWGAFDVRAGDRPWGREVYLRLDEKPPAPGTLASPKVGEGALPAAVDAPTRERVCGGG